jgi:hypothetical protein
MNGAAIGPCLCTNLPLSTARFVCRVAYGGGLRTATDGVLGQDASSLATTCNAISLQISGSKPFLANN